MHGEQQSEDQNYSFFVLLLSCHWWNRILKNHICTQERTDCIFQTRRLVQRWIMNTVHASYLQYKGSLGCAINTQWTMEVKPYEKRMQIPQNEWICDGLKSLCQVQIIYRSTSSLTLLLADHNHGCDLPYEAGHFHMLHSVHYCPIITIWTNKLHSILLKS